MTYDNYFFHSYNYWSGSREMQIPASKKQRTRSHNYIASALQTQDNMEHGYDTIQVLYIVEDPYVVTMKIILNLKTRVIII
jgi:hypothetical protein